MNIAFILLGLLLPLAYLLWQVNLKIPLQGRKTKSTLDWSGAVFQKTGSQDPGSIKMNPFPHGDFSSHWFNKYTALYPLKQELANYNTQNKYSSFSVSISVVLINSVIHIHLHIIYVYMQSSDRNHLIGNQSLKHFTIQSK